MSKLALIVLAAVVTFVAAQEGGCSGDNAAWVGTQPQNRGRPCAAQTPDNCKFIDESIKNCCTTCATRKDETPAPQQQQQQQQQPPKKKKKGCFSGKDRVHTKEYGTITMSELAQIRTDVQVLSRNDEGQLEYSDVRYWVHLQAEVSMKYLNLKTESGHQLPLTGEHLIYETDCRGGAGNAIFAKNVRVGRCVYVNQNGQLKESRVTEKSEEKLTGVYSPITSAGSIVVNDVLASCYSYYENEPLQKFIYHYVMDFQGLLKNWLPASIYQAAFNTQDGAAVGIPRLILNFLQIQSVFVH